MTEIETVVNGQSYEGEVEPRLLLLDLLRDRLRLTGTHAACEEGSCGSCTVLVDDTAVRSCLMLAVQAGGCEVVTVEGIGQPQALHPVQESLRAHHGLQCGFCTPGIVIAAVELLGDNPAPTPEEVRTALAGNLCRCTGYESIVDAVCEAANGSSDEDRGSEGGDRR